MPKKNTKTTITLRIEKELVEAIDKGAALNLRNRTKQAIWLLNLALEKVK